jgi:hypothetical protein
VSSFVSTFGASAVIPEEETTFLSLRSPKAGSTIPHQESGHSGMPGGKSSGNIGIFGRTTMAPPLSTSNQSYSRYFNIDPAKSIPLPGFSGTSLNGFSLIVAILVQSSESDFQTID